MWNEFSTYHIHYMVMIFNWIIIIINHIHINVPDIHYFIGDQHILPLANLTHKLAI